MKHVSEFPYFNSFTGRLSLLGPGADLFSTGIKIILKNIIIEVFR